MIFFSLIKYKSKFVKVVFGKILFFIESEWGVRIFLCFDFNFRLIIIVFKCNGENWSFSSYFEITRLFLKLKR